MNIKEAFDLLEDLVGWEGDEKHVEALRYLREKCSDDDEPVEGLDKAQFLEVLDQWEAHAIRGMRNGATAYHQGKIALITDLRDWINRED